MSDVCYVDVETTGLLPGVHEIYEVGLIDSEGGEHHWWLPVEHLGRADAVALNIGHYHDRHPLGNSHSPDYTKVSTLPQFAREFARLTWGQHLAGAVVSFDEERLRSLLHHYGQTHGWHYHLIDVENLAAGWLAGRYETKTQGDLNVLTLPLDSNELSLAVGVNPENFDRHTALGDCRWSKAIFEAVMGR